MKSAKASGSGSDQTGTRLDQTSSLYRLTCAHNQSLKRTSNRTEVLWHIVRLVQAVAGRLVPLLNESGCPGGGGAGGTRT